MPETESESPENTILHVPVSVDDTIPIPKGRVLADSEMAPETTPPPERFSPTNKITVIQDTGVGTEITKYGYKDVDQSINSAFIFKESNSSTICDIIAMYLKGQKILYTEAKTVCEQRLNYLMLPAILITSICTIFSILFKDQSYGPTVVSSLNGFNAFLLALINYLKLDAKAEAHRTAAYKFDKLQSFMEFNSGKMLFDSAASSRLVEIIKETEGNVREIKETNQFILPEKIRYSYPVLYNTNVFAEVKKIQNQEMMHINTIKDCLNRMLEIQQSTTGTLSDDLQTEVKYLDTRQKREIQEILKIKNKYLNIDELFENEMKANRNRISNRFQLCGWLKA